MTLVAAAGGYYFPNFLTNVDIQGTTATIDAATEKFANIGRIYIDGRPTAAKTLSTGTIQFRVGALTFANGGTTVDVGIQDVATGAGPIARPDGTFDVKTTLTGGGGGLTANAWNTATMTSGSKSITHGDLIAVVWDMTARGGASDSVVIAPGNHTFASLMSFPTTNAFVSSAWQTTQTIGARQLPQVAIVFDDGTLATIDGTIPYSSASQDTYADSTNPDERGMVFQVPWKCKIDAIFAVCGITDAASDFTLKLYSDPVGTPALIASTTVLAENMSVAADQRPCVFNLPTEFLLQPNTDYGVTLLATGTTNCRLKFNTLGAAGHRAFILGGTTVKKITRDGSAGAFTAEVTPVTMYNIGVRISQFDNGIGTPPPTYRIGI